MKDQLQTKLIEILSSAQSVGGDIYEQVKFQAPILAEEIIKWRIIELWFNFVALSAIWGLFIIGGWMIHKTINRQVEKANWDGFHVLRIPMVACFIVCFILFGRAAQNIKSIVQSHYAPRVFFIQSCQELIKPAK